MSSIRAIAVYSTKGTIVFEPSFEFFTPGRKYIYRMRSFYNRFPDRHYGYGFDANERVVVYDTNRDDEREIDTVNYLPFNSDRFHMTLTGLRKVAPNFHVGLLYQFETVGRYRLLADSVEILTEAGESDLLIDELPNQSLANDRRSEFFGRRSGIGVAATLDNRTNVDNPLSGTFIQFNNLYFTKVLGSQFNFVSMDLDARHYINTYKDQTLALRVRAQNNFGLGANGLVPIRAMGRVGGRDFIRGYYFGTYQANHLLASELEYRLPIFNDYDAPIWQFWKHLGITGFIGAANVYDSPEELALANTRVAAGMGLRIMINSDQRSSIRIDYGFGLNDGSNYQGRQTGLYFFLNEAF